MKLEIKDNEEIEIILDGVSFLIKKEYLGLSIERIDGDEIKVEKKYNSFKFW